MKKVEKVERPIIPVDQPMTVGMLKDACRWVQANHERLRGYRTRARALHNETVAPFHEDHSLLLRTNITSPRFRFPDGFNGRAAAMVRAELRADAYNSQYEVDRLRLEEEIDNNLAMYEPLTRIQSGAPFGITHLYNENRSGFQTHGVSFGSESVAEGTAQELSLGPSSLLYIAAEDKNHVFRAHVLNPLVEIEFIV